MKESTRRSPPQWLPFVLVPFAILFVGRTLAAFATIIQPRLAIHYDIWFETGMLNTGLPVARSRSRE